MLATVSIKTSILEARSKPQLSHTGEWAQVSYDAISHDEILDTN